MDRAAPPPGRPALDLEAREVILRLGRENPRWGYQRIRGELMKLGVSVSATTIGNVLRRHGLGPLPGAARIKRRLCSKIGPVGA